MCRSEAAAALLAPALGRPRSPKVAYPAAFWTPTGGDGYEVDFKDDKAARHVERTVRGAPQRATQRATPAS